MRITEGFGPAGAVAAALAVSMLAAPVNAETVMTVNGVDVDSAVVDLYIESRTQKAAAQVSGGERDALVDELKDIYLLTTQSRTEELAKDPQTQAQIELQRRGILAQVTATDYLDQNQATDEEVLAEYAEQIKLAPPQQFKARHILVESQSTAAELITELQGGANFEDLAREHSTGPSGPTGGDLGWFSPNQMVKPFSDAVAAMEDGAFTEAPVQTQFGWHVILREGSRDSEPPPLEGVRDVIKQRIEQRKLQEYLVELRESDSG